MNKSVHKKIIIALCILAVGGLSSCETSKLDPTPKTSYPATAVFETPQRIDQQVNGIYDGAKAGQFLGGRALIYGDIWADQFINMQTNAVTGYQTWNHTLVETNNEVNNMWSAAYAGINLANVFLQGLEDNKATFVEPVFSADFVTTKVPQYQAEARFVRAISYFYLLQFYAKPYIDNNGNNPGLPLRLRAETDNTGNDLARSSVAEVYNQILEDLNFAEQNLPATAPAGRAHQNAAIAFKTRVYLAMTRYSDVITEANKIVSESAPFKANTGIQHRLAPTYAAIFAPPQEDLESIFSFPFSAIDAPGTQNQLAYYYLPAARNDGGAVGNGEYSLNTNGVLKDSTNWKATDARRQLIYTATNSRTGAKTYYLLKYSTGTPYTDKAPIIRYAEVLLNLAEARVRANNAVDEQAVALLNAVHGRSDASTQYVSTDFADATALLNAILRERTIEFLGEGLRSFDLMRQNLPIPAKGPVSALLPSDPTYIWPIPSTELNANKAITRN